MNDKIKEIIRNNSGEVNQYGFKAIEIRKGELDKIADEIVKFCNLHIVSQQRELLAAFVKDWYKDNPLVDERKQLKMVDKFLAAYSG